MISNRELRWVYHTPFLIGWFRVAMTILLIFWNFLHIPLVGMQLLSVCTYCVSIFQYRMFKNDVPVISIILPLILHWALAGVLNKQVVIVGMIPLMVLDLLYLGVLMLKASKFPFVIDGEEDEEMLEEV